MPNYKLIINPIPLKKKHRIFLENLKEKLLKDDINFSYEYTTKDKSATSIAKYASKKYDIIVACGGDGTIMEVINGIYGTKSKLAILPLGTSNDFTKHLGINLNNCVSIMVGRNQTRIDLGLVEYSSGNKTKKSLFCSTSGIGFDAKLLQLNKYSFFIKMKKVLGNLIYPLVAFFLLFFYNGREAEIKLNNKKIKIRLFMLNANFVKSMSGIKVTKNADVSNGIFDIVIFENAPIFKKLVGFVWYAITPKKLNFNEIDYISKNDLGVNKYNISNIKSFSIKSKKPIEVQLNGDFVGYTPARFKLLPEALNLIR